VNITIAKLKGSVLDLIGAKFNIITVVDKIHIYILIVKIIKHYNNYFLFLYYNKQTNKQINKRIS